MAGDDDDRVDQVHYHPYVDHLDVGGGGQRVEGGDEDGANGHHDGGIHSNYTWQIKFTIPEIYRDKAMDDKCLCTFSKIFHL